MSKRLILEEITTESLDAVLSLPAVNKANYFSELLKTFYPNIEESSDEYTDMLELYISSFYVEKLYRTNRFFNEKFTPIYTQTGLIRNIIADRYFTDDDLITH